MTMRKGLPAKLALTDADDTRYDFKNLVVANADGTPRGGLTGPVGATLVTGSATMNVSVGAFQAVAIRDGGAILLASDGPTNVLIGAAPATNQRTDIIYAKQNDASTTVVSPDANNTPVLGVVAGAAGPSGGTPGSLPVGAVEIARIVLTAGNTTTNAAVISQTAQFTAAPGGAVPFPTLALLTAWTTAQPSQYAQVFADGAPENNGLYRLTSGAWKLVVGDTGWITPTLGSGVTSDTANSQIVQYRRLNGVVYLHGRPLSAASTDAFTLPPGFRPSTEMYYMVGSSASQTVSTRVVVRTNGTVAITAATSPTLSPVSFIADV